MKLSLPNAITSRAGRQVLIAQKHSPQLLFGAGIVLMGATVVSACKATLKLDETLGEMQSNLEDIQADAALNPNRTEGETKKVTTYVYLRNVYRVGKLYLPSFVLGSLAVAALTGSHHIMSKRNAGLSAALAATERALNNYRERVRDEIGDDREREVYQDVKTKKVAELDEDGEPKKTKKTIKSGGGMSPYATWWGLDSTTEWSPTPEINLARLSAAQEYANIRLRAKGHLLLNDIFDAIGLPRTPAGSQVGWLYNHKDAKDETIDFGVLTGDCQRFLDFVQGYENGIWLDFNVDGEIWRNI